MPDGEVALDARQAALTALLSGDRGAVLAALGDDGSRISLPDSFALGEHQALAVPERRETMLHVVVAADRLSVVAAWERARVHGIGVTAVRALSDPERCLRLSIVDARELHGVWLAVLTHNDEAVEEASGGWRGALVVPSRPRQATIHKSHSAIITEVDANVTGMLGWAPEQMLGSRSTEFIHPEDRDRAVASWMAMYSVRGSQRVRLRHRCADGGWLWVEVEHIHNGAENADRVDVVAHISDISDEMAAYEALRRREQLFSRLSEALPTGVLQLRHDGTVTYANARLGEILQATMPSVASDLLAAISADHRAGVEAAIQAALAVRADGELEVEIRLGGVAGIRRCALTVAAVEDHDGQPAVLVCVNDITESAALRDELHRQATHDALTGLPNHRALISAIDHELERARRNGRPFALLFVDIDHFKTINDTLGHGAGDGALRETGQMIKASLRAVDIVGRWGGEEFVVLLPETDTPGALKAAERVRAAIAKHRYQSAQRAHLTCSIGVATQPEDGTDCDTLIANADRAMYAAKQLGRNQVIAASDQAAAMLVADASSPSREQQARLRTVEALVAVVDARDSYTATHSTEVATLAQRVAVMLGCDANQTQLIGLAARLHDIGKVAIPDAILNKPGRLTNDEWQQIKQHPAIGAAIVTRIPSLRPLAQLIRAHHERYDGTGYPDQLAQDAIPLGARIICAADAYNAMITDRPYRDARSPRRALQELKRHAGTQFDPNVIRAISRLLDNQQNEQQAA